MAEIKAARADIVAGNRTTGGGRRMLLWDAPNMDMCLSEVIGERASAGTRPDMGAIIAWLRDRCDPSDVLEAAVFANVARGFEGAMAGWVASLRHLGWAVFVKPKQHRRDDVDVEMVRHLDRRFNQGRLREVIVASHDAKAFAQPLVRLSRAGVDVVVLGFRERAGFAAEHSDVVFVDIEDVAGAFARPLPRTNLFDLPSAGRWFAPFVEVQPAHDDGPEASPEEGGGDGGPVEPSGLEPVAGAGAPPSRADVVHLVITEVEAAIGVGSAGLLLLHAGELLRDRFPGFSLEDAGFTSHTDLLDELLATREVTVERTDAGALLLRPAVIDLTDSAGAGEDGGAATAEPAEPDEPTEAAAIAPAGAPPAGGADQRTGAGGQAEPGEPGPDVGRAEPIDGVGRVEPPVPSEPAPPEADHDVELAQPAGPPDGANAIYRMFGYRPPGAGAG